LAWCWTTFFEKLLLEVCTLIQFSNDQIIDSENKNPEQTTTNDKNECIKSAAKPIKFIPEFI
jgi:hypothetical protein